MNPERAALSASRLSAGGFANALGRVSGQTAIYTAALLATSLGNAGAGVIVARSVSTQDFGVYSFVISTLSLLALIFEFGIFFPAARITAHQTKADSRLTVGAVLVLFAPVAALFGLTVAAVALCTDRYFAVHASSTFLIAAPLAFVVPFRIVGQWLGQGTGTLAPFAIASTSAGVSSIIVLLGWRQFHGLTPGTAIVIQLLATLAAWTWFVLRFRPRFTHLATTSRLLWSHARAYGFRIYIGRVLSTGTYQMDVVMLAGLRSAPVVGFYVLAGAISNGAALPVVALAITSFHKLAHEARIPARYVATSWFGALITSALAVALARPIIGLMYSDRYIEATSLVLPLALASGLRAVTMMYNTFLAAHGQGRALSNASLALTITNVVLNVALIPPFGAAGAAWASFMALIVNYIFHVRAYGRQPVA